MQVTGDNHLMDTSNNLAPLRPGLCLVVCSSLQNVDELSQVIATAQ